MAKTSNHLPVKGKNWQDGGDMPMNDSSKLSSQAKESAPMTEGNPYTPQTSQSNIRGKQGQ